jgi:predicted nucleic acid-binding protein
VSTLSRTPLILDTSVLTAVARGDADIIALVEEYDARGQPIVIPALAIAGASLDVRSEEGDDLLAGLELLEVVTVVPLSGAEQAARLAHLVARTRLDPWDAHVAAIADVAISPILTLNAPKWEHASADLDDPLHIIEIADPGDQKPGK